MIRQTILWLSLSLLVQVVQAQETFPTNGAPDKREGLMAFTNATIYKTYNQKLENATLIVRKGKVEGIGTSISIPAGAVVKDCSGMTIYPSFIEIYSDYGLPEPKAVGKRPNRRPQLLSNKKGAFGWNEAIKPEYNSAEEFVIDDNSAKELRALGFGVTQSHKMDGISRGAGVVVLLGGNNEQETIINSSSGHFLSFSKGKSTQSYPNSLMGSIALLRQTELDAKWYSRQGSKDQTNLSLEAWNNLQSVPHYFETRDRLELLRAAKLGKEINKNLVVVGNGDEYMRSDEIKATGLRLIVPVDFPKPYDVEDPYDALQADLNDLRHWELAPSNLARLEKKQIDFAITSHGLKNKKDFLKNVSKAIKHGLAEEEALKSLTHSPSVFLQMQNQIGSLETGRLANFLICSGNIFSEQTKIYENYVKGSAHKINPTPGKDLSGKYQLKIGRQNYDLEIASKGGKSSGKIIYNDSLSTKVTMAVNADELINLSFTPNGSEELLRLSGVISDNRWEGKGKGSAGTWFSWWAERTGELKPTDKKDKKKTQQEITYKSKITYPFLPYGWTSAPTTEKTLITNATVWTNETEGILLNADVLILDGKISAVGKDIKAPAGTATIDGTGMHLTSGVIDEHSHIAISRGVNESSQSSTAEVSISDVVNSEDINIYRQLSGGVTASQLLHGSANPIGGQSAIIKLRWGKSPEEMKIKGADPFIKFALGENVKQSNRSSQWNLRFPQSRMGVEQTFVDHFARAQDYAKLKKSGVPYRTDLELEALSEIIESKRFISCHSYVQSEINMLMKVAERFGFRVNTFTHILEGYKVADKMAAHGVGGSTFSDWWAYKAEVKEAIPHNAGMMHEQGVVVAINSDDAEMARRLNQEAAKAVKYSGISEEDAWKMVTLNPAKLLHLDHRMGSVKKGKDADLVLWNDHPLSIYAVAEKTWVDGVRYFDRERDAKLRKEIAEERAMLVQKMIAEKNNGGETQGVKRRPTKLYHCDTIEGEVHHHSH